MRIPTASNLFKIFIILLVLTPISNCRDISAPASEESELRIRARFNSFFLKHFSAVPHYADPEKNKHKKLHVVVRRLVPQGPNPLHN
ncbi:UNVERIFIED_CONTAM: hypothetical protein Sangu_0746500 [Sesamum angustifolium]|uniref:Uncharacterized protein n=1 Tax=Sesamum angustifolium TaxID=2727405 RepID=A0AAW2PV26_9LAMI